MHQALYRKWRPKNFCDVCGQEHITKILEYESAQGRFNHAYLFCGSRGTGKTSCAKILAKAVNCENPQNGNPCGVCDACLAIESGAATDVLEMDAASNNGVDNIRDIRDEVLYPPSMLKYRVYIVDEVHMLSDSAFNALLKTLEEPPSYVIFILATTELHQLPSTIISRCQRFEFRRISTDVIVSRLRQIADAEGINITRDALFVIAKQAQGGMRDAISLLELCAGGNRNAVIDEKSVNDIIGISGRDTLASVVKAVAQKDFETIFAEIDNVVRSSKDIAVFWQNLMSYYRDMLIVKTSKNAASYLDLTENEQKLLEESAGLFTRETVMSHCKQIEGALFSIQKSNATKRTVAEITLMKMCDETLDTSNESLLSRISMIEDRLALGVIPAVVQGGEKCEGDEPKATQKATAPKSQAPTVETPIATEAEVKLVSEKPVKAVRTESKNTAMKSVSCWADVADRLSQIDSQLGSYMKISRAYISDDGHIKVLIPDGFTLLMMGDEKKREAVRAALSVCLKREISKENLKFDLSTSALSDNEEDLTIDEILKNAN